MGYLYMNTFAKHKALKTSFHNLHEINSLLQQQNGNIHAQ